MKKEIRLNKTMCNLEPVFNRAIDEVVTEVYHVEDVQNRAAVLIEFQPITGDYREFFIEDRIYILKDKYIGIMSYLTFLKTPLKDLK